MVLQYPQARPRPTRAKLGDPQRNSSVVRASVLETALELGFGQNSTVAHWIFNNPLSEEAEDLHAAPEDDQPRLDPEAEPALRVADAITPTFTSGSNSTSDESSSLNSPGNIAPSAAVTTIQVHAHKPSITESPHVHFGDFSSDQLQLFSPFALSPHEIRPEETRDLLGKLPRDTERSRSQDDGLRRNPDHESPSPGLTDTGYTSEGQYLSKGNVTKGKGKPGKPKSTSGWKRKTLDANNTNEKDGDYTSDGGYLSASSNKSQGKSPGKVKSRAMAFFRRRPKKSGRGSDDEGEDGIPPVPAIPVLPRPSSPRPLERRAAPSSPTRPGFSPLALNLTSPPASPPRRRVSKSPPPAHVRVTPPQQPDPPSVPLGPPSPQASSPSAPTVLTPAATAATFPLPHSMPATPLSTASFPVTSPPSTQPGPGTPKTLTTSSSRQHLAIPPPAPPPTLPLPQLPPSPSTSSNGSSNGISPPLLATPTTPSRKGIPTRPIPVVPTTPGSTRPLTPRRTASPFRPILSPRVLPTAMPHSRNGELLDVSEGDQLNGKGADGRQRSGSALSARLGNTPAFLQRRIQHGPPPSPRHPPPDMPLPPSPCPPSTRPRTPIGSPSKFHEHFSSVSSVPSSQVLSTPASMSPSPSTSTLSGSSSGPSVRSSHISSISGRSDGPAIRDSLNAFEYSRPTTSASTVSEVSYGRPIPSTLGRPPMDLKYQCLDRSDVSSSIYSQAMHRDNSSVITYDDDADVDDATPESCADEDDDASVYTSDDKTAGRRTMYLMEHGELDENGDEIVVTGSHYWGGYEAPPIPPLPPMPVRPGPGYF